MSFGVYFSLQLSSQFLAYCITNKNVWKPISGCVICLISQTSKRPFPKQIKRFFLSLETLLRRRRTEKGRMMTRQISFPSKAKDNLCEKPKRPRPNKAQLNYFLICLFNTTFWVVHNLPNFTCIFLASLPYWCHLKSNPSVSIF